jgi:four helix bundle protein
MRDFRNIKAWEKSHQLALATYKATQSFPSDERFGLISQARRAATSIPTNIAEGCGRDTDKELAYFLRVAAGSSSELEYLFLAAKDLGYLKADTYTKLDQQVNKVKKMLNGFIKSLQSTKG